MKKVGNILCIVLAWLLSIVLVVMLTVTPIALSALSLLNSHVITDVVIDVFMELVEQEKNRHKAADYQLNNLAEVNIPQDVLDQIPESIPQDVLDQIPESIPQDVQDALNKLPESNTDNQNQGATDSKPQAATGGIAGILESYLGTPVTAEQVEKVLSSNTVKEILTVYTGDLTSVLTGQEKLSDLDAQKIKAIVNNNINEVVQIVQELKPEMAQKETEKLKTEITQVVEEKAEEILQVIPKPEEIKEMIIEDAPEIGVALKILEKRKTIELGLIGTIGVLCVLIFLCRLGGFRGFRWLAVDMFVGGGINALLSLVILIETPAVVRMVPDSALNSVVNNVLHAFDLALFERATIILVAGGLLLTAYILIKKARAKKADVATVDTTAAKTEE